MFISHVEKLGATISQTSNEETVRRNQTIILFKLQNVMGSHTNASRIEAINEQIQVSAAQ